MTRRRALKLLRQQESGTLCASFRRDANGEVIFRAPGAQLRRAAVALVACAVLGCTPWGDDDTSFPGAGEVCVQHEEGVLICEDLDAPFSIDLPDPLPEPSLDPLPQAEPPITAGDGLSPAAEDVGCDAPEAPMSRLELHLDEETGLVGFVLVRPTNDPTPESSPLDGLTGLEREREQRRRRRRYRRQRR